MMLRAAFLARVLAGAEDGVRLYDVRMPGDHLALLVRRDAGGGPASTTRR